MSNRKRALGLIYTRWEEVTPFPDEEVDSLLRIALSQPARPEGRLPYEGLYGWGKSISNYRALALGTIKSRESTLPDEVIDSLLRLLVNQPPRPEGDPPYAGLFGVEVATNAGGNSQIPNPLPRGNILLKVPFYSQRDNRLQPWRECCSSSAAMVAEALKPGIVHGSDDYYVEKILRKYGDTTDHSAHTRALRELGIESEFIYNADFKDIDEQLHQGYPVLFAYLHRGTPDRPTGGHCAVVIGREIDGAYRINDPWGSYAPDFFNPHHGANLIYSKNFFTNRWLVRKRNSGWMRRILHVK